jgi:signal peptidase II
VVALVLWVSLFFSRRQSTSIAMALISVGALGNGLDYFWYGHVVDMVKLVFWDYHYPVFNVADAAICMGELIIFFSGMATKGRTNQSLVWRH